MRYKKWIPREMEENSNIQMTKLSVENKNGAVDKREQNELLGPNVTRNRSYEY